MKPVRRCKGVGVGHAGEIADLESPVIARVSSPRVPPARGPTTVAPSDLAALVPELVLRGD